MQSSGALFILHVRALPILVVTGCLAGGALLVVSCAGQAGIALLLAVAGVVGFVALHYLLWGAWLSKSIRQAQEAEDANQPADE